MIRLALRNIVQARARFAACVLGIAFSTFLMFFQGSLIIGFLAAAGKLISAPAADAWIAPRGVPCFDFSAPLPGRIADLVRGLPDVVDATRIVVGWAWWRSPAGVRRTVVVVGAEPNVGGTFPSPRPKGHHEADGVVVDSSSLPNLAIAAVPCEVELNSHRARVVGSIDGFGSFLGSPYAFAELEDARRWLGMDAETASFIVVRFATGTDRARGVAALQRRFPEVDVHDSREFARSAGLYWMIQTGAGGAIGLAGILGFVVGCVVVSQTIYATTLENIEEFATLRAIGAKRGFVRGVVIAQALACCTIGTILGLAGALPLVATARRNVVSWIDGPAWWMLTVVALSILMCSLAAIVSMRAAVTVEPARVFRA